MKRILILGAGLYNKRVYDKVKRAGYHVIGADKNPDAEGKDAADEFYPVDIVAKDEVLELARSMKIDGIMNLNEFGSRTASYVANQLQLNGHSYETAESTNDKGLMRDIWSQNGLAIPQYKVFREEQEIFEHIKLVGYPAVLKPADSGGSGRGISIIKTEEDLSWAYAFAKNYARNGRFILEQFIEGTELTIETFSINSKVYMLALSDKVKPDIKTRVATSLNYPAAISKEVKGKVEALVSGAVNALGIKNGIGHTEVIVTKEGKPYLVETAARGGGGHIFHTIIEAVSGIDAPALQASWLVGEPLAIDSILENGCCYRFFSTSHGILKSVKNIERARQMEGVLDLGIAKKAGEEVGNLENSLHRAGFVVTVGKDRQQAVERANKVEDTVIFEVEPLQAK